MKTISKLGYNIFKYKTINNRIMFKWAIMAIIVIFLIIICYNYVDRPVVYFFHSHSLHHYKILDYIAELPAVILFLVPLGLLYLLIKFSLGRLNYLDSVCYILIIVLSVGFTVRESLKYIFCRSWPDTFYGNPSLIVDEVYGFHWLSFNQVYRSFPSGHMIAISSISMVLYLLYPKFRYLYLALTLLVGMSQLVLYYHFASDIIAGVFIGGIIGYYITLTKPFYFLHKNKLNNLLL